MLVLRHTSLPWEQLKIDNGQFNEHHQLLAPVSKWVFHGVHILKWTKYSDILNTENLIISTITEKTVAKKYSIKFHLGGQLLSPIILSQSLSLRPLSISQHCMSGARFQNPRKEKVSFTNLILLLF